VGGPLPGAGPAGHNKQWESMETAGGGGLQVQGHRRLASWQGSSCATVLRKGIQAKTQGGPPLLPGAGPVGHNKQGREVITG
jgi:hypothetical protein